MGLDNPKKVLCLFGLLAVMSPLVGCWSTHPAFPPDAAAVADIVESLGFDWTLSEEDAVSYPDGRVTFSLYGEGYPEALIGCSGPQEAKAMQLFFGMPLLPEKPRFAWEDWEDHFSLAEQLYGGFSDEGELYRAFSAQEIPESVDLGRMHTWRAELPSARCTVSWRTERTGTAGGQGPSEGWTGRLSMTILEAEDLPQEPADSSHP